MHDAKGLAGRHITFFSWRDTSNPEGGGAERYLEKVAVGLVAGGCQVTIFCAEHEDAPRDEVRDGIRFVRRGRKMSVYVRGMWALASRSLGNTDLVVDVQNGLPFFTRLVTRKPVVVLVHHVHREQWPVVYPGLTGRIGWWIESHLAPRLYRGSQYVAVSRATRGELQKLGVDSARVAVVHNGTDPVVAVNTTKSIHPTICVVGRLVPHKQVEHAIDAVLELRREMPDIVMHVVGSGWWEPELHAYADAHDATGTVVFEGHVDERRKQAIYEQAWVMALPSLKEGWGLVVGEAGMHRTPTVAYRAAGGTRESIDDGRSGILVDSAEELTEALHRVLTDHSLRETLGEGALAMGHQFTWSSAQASFAAVLAGVLDGDRMNAQDPDLEQGSTSSSRTE